MTEKEKHIKRISTKKLSHVLVGVGSAFMPNEVLGVSYSNTEYKEMIVRDSTFNVTENPLTGCLDVVIKVSLDKEVPYDDPNCL
jgi:hypothetical protein